MKSFIWLIPMAVFLIVGFASGAYINVRDQRLVRNPDGVWGPGRLFNDAEWTEQGLAARRRFFRGISIALLFAIAAVVTVKVVTGE
jgi:hypothetical protein